MPRKKKDARVLNIKLATPAYDRLDAFCEASGLSKTEATEQILSQYIDSFFRKQKEHDSLLHTSEQGVTDR